MLELLWGGYGKTFSPKPWGLRDYRLNKGLFGRPNFFIHGRHIYIFSRLKERVVMQGMTESVFLKFSLLKEKMISQIRWHEKLKAFDRNICVYNKSKAQIKNGLYHALHIDVFFQTRKKIGIYMPTLDEETWNGIFKSVNWEKMEIVFGFSGKYMDFLVLVENFVRKQDILIKKLLSFWKTKTRAVSHAFISILHFLMKTDFLRGPYWNFDTPLILQYFQTKFTAQSKVRSLNYDVEVDNDAE